MKGEGLSINIKGYLMDMDIPKVMGILNVTPDSFYHSGRVSAESEIEKRVRQMILEGVDIIDVGGCSTRPGFESPSIKEEIKRVEKGCRLVREISPTIPLSVDTFRVPVAKYAIENWDADIINDISGGCKEMWQLAASTKTAYVLTYNEENLGRDNRDITAELITSLSKKLNEINRIGVNDVILDPGFGFAKSLKENFQLLDELREIKKMGYPVLVGISRKSMIYKTLDCDPDQALVGTIALNAIALEKGADILRVHDVKEAVETVTLISKMYD